MKIPEAIKILTSLANRLAHVSQAEEQTAVRLGIEALEAFEAFRSGKGVLHYPTLPGETK